MPLTTSGAPRPHRSEREAAGSRPSDANGAWAGQRVVDQLELDAVADLERVEQRGLGVLPVEEHVAAVTHPNQAVALPIQHANDSADRMLAAFFGLFAFGA